MKLNQLQVPLLFILILLNQNGVAQDPVTIPKKLAVFYGWPGLLNGHCQIGPTAACLDAVVNDLNRYDIVILSRNLQLDQSCVCQGYDQSSLCYGTMTNSGNNVWENPPARIWDRHCDHDNSRSIIRRLHEMPKKTEVYGYVSIGGENTYRRYSTIEGGPPDTGQKPLSLSEIQTAIYMWDYVMGVDGIFLDEAEYGFGTTRERQNTIINYIHNFHPPLKVFINAFHPDDVFSNNIVRNVYYPSIPVKISYQVVMNQSSQALVTHLLNWEVNQSVLIPHGYMTGDIIRFTDMSGVMIDPILHGEKSITVSSDPFKYGFSFPQVTMPATGLPFDARSSRRSLFPMNPDGLPTNLQPGDIYMLEGFQILSGNEQDHLYNRTANAVVYKRQHDITIAGLTTLRENDVYDQNKLNYAWWSALLYGIDFVGWGEPGFSESGANANQLPYRPRPNESPVNRRPGGLSVDAELGLNYTSNVTRNGGLYTRTTECGSIEVNATSGPLQNLAAYSGRFVFNAPAPIATSSRPGNASATIDNNPTGTPFVTNYHDWQYITIDLGCPMTVTGFRRHMSTDPSRSDGNLHQRHSLNNRGVQGEGFSYSIDGRNWTKVTSQIATGWESYVNYVPHAWHSVPYGWSNDLNLIHPKQVRYVRFQWDDNYDKLNGIQIFGSSRRVLVGN